MHACMMQSSFGVGAERPAVGLRLPLGEISFGVEHKQPAAPAATTVLLFFPADLGPFEVVKQLAWRRAVLQAFDHDVKIDELAYLELLFDLLVLLHWLKLLVRGGLVEEEGDFVEAVNDGVVERPEVGQVAMAFNVGTALHKHFDRVFMIVEDCRPEGREAVGVAVVHSHSVVEQKSHHAVAASAAGLCQQGASPVELVGKVAITLQDDLHRGEVVAFDVGGQIIGAVLRWLLDCAHANQQLQHSQACIIQIL